MKREKFEYINIENEFEKHTNPAFSPSDVSLKLGTKKTRALAN